jgi:uncharacterized protein (DUF1810 family)
MIAVLSRACVSRPGRQRGRLAARPGRGRGAVLAGRLADAQHLRWMTVANVSVGTDRNDLYDLTRFIRAQERVYADVLAELRGGQKLTHWMWFIFPQIDGLGNSSTTKYYAIKSIDEARQYLSHPVLGPRLLECAETVLAIRGRSVSEIFGYPDDLKLRSSMTLFACVAGPDSVFDRVLDGCFPGERDARTLQLLKTR